MSTYTMDNNNMILIYTLERMNDNMDKINSVVGHEICQNRNDANKRKYAEIYKNVKTSISYEKPYLDALLDTRIMHMFYNDECIQKMYAKWAHAKYRLDQL